MRNAIRVLGLTVAVVLLNPMLALADGCAMYTYRDQWIDGDGNAVFQNYVQGDDSCGTYSAYADVTLTLPNGSSVHGSSAGATFAEALAQGETSNPTGDGSIAEESDVDYACGTASNLLGSPVQFNGGLEFIWYDDPVLIGVGLQCGYTRIANCSRAEGVYCGDAHPANPLRMHRQLGNTLYLGTRDIWLWRG